MIRGMKEKDFLYLIAGYILVMGVVPCLEFCLWQGHVTIHESFSPILFMVPNIFFALIGYYLEHVLDFRKNRTRRILIGITFSVVAVALTCVMTDYWMRTTSKHSTEQLERFFDCFICIPAMSVYCIMKCAGEKICSAKMQKLLPLLGGATFGIYLTEKFSRAITDTIYTLTTPFLGSFAASVLWAFSSLIVSLLVILLSKNIPVVKKIVNKFI
jgi:peptidoglycan/LPS O-acetylase OafA/YrhL